MSAKTGYVKMMKLYLHLWCLIELCFITGRNTHQKAVYKTDSDK